jgi:uncharacterized protein GlcG (DUF336 family)
MQTRFTRLFSAIVAGTACLISSQIAVAAPPPLIFVPPRPAVPVASDISLNLAIAGAQAALEACNKTSINIAVVVVDRFDNIRAAMVSDGLPRGWLAQVEDGAYTVLKTGMSSRDYKESLAPDSQKLTDAGKPLPGVDVTDSEMQNLRDAAKADPHLYFFPGAVAIRKAGVIVGAVSAAGPARRQADGNSGFDTAEPCAVVGRDKIEAGF